MTSTISALDLVAEFKRSGKFDELRRYLLEEFSQSPNGQQLLTSLNRLAQECEATSKTALIAALSKSALFNGRNGVVGGNVLHSLQFKDQVRTQLRYSLSDLKKGKPKSLLNLLPDDAQLHEDAHNPNDISAPDKKESIEAVPGNGKDEEDDAMDVDDVEDLEQVVDMVLDDDVESVDLLEQAKGVLEEGGEVVQQKDEVESANDQQEHKPPMIHFTVGQIVACQVETSYYLCKVISVPSIETESEGDGKMYELVDICQHFEEDNDGSVVAAIEQNHIRSSKLVNVMDEALFDKIQLGDRAFAIYRDEEDDDNNLVNNEFYPCEVVGMAKNGLFVKFDDSDRHIVKLGEIIKAD